MKKKPQPDFTIPLNVADLLLGFCWRRPEDFLLDPACGDGTLLARASQWQQWLLDRTLPNRLWGMGAEATDGATAVLYPQPFLITPPDGLPTFDAIVGNPPYTRARHISRATPQAEQQLSLFAAEPATPTTPDITQALWQQLNGRSGLYAYYFLHAARFLRENGRLGFIVPGSWLDVASGSDLKQFLLNHYKVVVIAESSAERWFNNSRIHTCLVILERCSGPNRRAANLVRMVRLKRPLSHFLPDPPDSYRRVERLEQLIPRLMPSQDHTSPDADVRVIPQSALTPERRWGLNLRTSATTHAAIQSDDTPALGTWATLQRGYTTGANSFFYLDDDTINRWQIEPDFRRPLLKSLRHLDRLVLHPEMAQTELLWVPAAAHLAETAVSHYLAWGEKQGIHQRRTCASRQPWYTLPAQPHTSIILPKGIWQRHMAPMLAAPLLVDQQLYQVHLAADVPPPVAAALLNSSWFALQCELHGRTNLGDGLLWLAAYELARIPLPDPRHIPASLANELVTHLTALSQQPTPPVMAALDLPARQALDTAVFDLLQLSHTRRQQVLAALRERVQTRTDRIHAPPTADLS